MYRYKPLNWFQKSILLSLAFVAELGCKPTNNKKDNISPGYSNANIKSTTAEAEQSVGVAIGEFSLTGEGNLLDSLILQCKGSVRDHQRLQKVENTMSEKGLLENTDLVGAYRQDVFRDINKIESLVSGDSEFLYFAIIQEYENVVLLFRSSESLDELYINYANTLGSPLTTISIGTLTILKNFVYISNFHALSAEQLSNGNIVNVLVDHCAQEEAALALTVKLPVGSSAPKTTAPAPRPTSKDLIFQINKLKKVDSPVKAKGSLETKPKNTEVAEEVLSSPIPLKKTEETVNDRTTFGDDEAFFGLSFKDRIAKVDGMIKKRPKQKIIQVLTGEPPAGTSIPWGTKPKPREYGLAIKARDAKRASEKAKASPDSVRKGEEADATTSTNTVSRSSPDSSTTGSSPNTSNARSFWVVFGGGAATGAAIGAGVGIGGYLLFEIGD